MERLAAKSGSIRQYDHEVQGGSVVKPLVGVRNDGPGDALGRDAGARFMEGPRHLLRHQSTFGRYRSLRNGRERHRRSGAKRGFGRRRPEAYLAARQPCWGNTDRPETLGSLVRAAQACRDLALAYGMPFISGKDSLNNEFRHAGEIIVIPPTLLISAMGIIPDVRRCVTMDLKEAGNTLYLVGKTTDALGGSHLNLVTGATGGAVPKVDVKLAPKIFAAVHQAISQGLIRSCHDLSEGGIAVALAEMAFAGEVGATSPASPRCRACRTKPCSSPNRRPVSSWKRLPPKPRPSRRHSPACP
ncbi:MAG: AIR synthase-related protein [Gemmataceae bacterium]